VEKNLKMWKTMWKTFRKFREFSTMWKTFSTL